MSTNILQTINVVAVKELIDHLRDRRTALMIFLLSIAMGPLILVGISYFISSAEQKAEKKEFFVDGIANSPQLANFMARQDVTNKTPKEDFRVLIKQGKHDAVLVIPKDFEAKFLTGDAKVELIFDDTRQDLSATAIRSLQAQLRGFNAEVASQRLIARGVSPSVLRPVEVQSINLGTNAQKAAMLLFIIPMMALFIGISGCTAVAIDMTAGERERGSMEPLLMNPVTRLAIVLGKWLAVAIYGFGVVMLVLLGFYVALTFLPLPKIADVVSLSPAQYAAFALTLVSFAPAMGALQMLIATYGRSFKEAQTYVSYLITVAALMPSLIMFSQIKDATWQLFVPVMGQQMVLTRILRGDPVDAIHFLLPLGVNIALVVIAVTLIAKLLHNEKIIFGRA